MSDTLPAKCLLAFYGDDFTGSTDVMEAFTAAGIDTVLFLHLPTPDWLQRFSGKRCIGMAGVARAHSPEWMKRELPEVFERLRQTGAPIIQYKVCSTFDSSAETGSIGCAIDIGAQGSNGSWSPIIVGVPRLKRYQLFGHLFAAADGVGWRLDRHPTMSRHPVTPMLESDLRLHLAEQTERPIELIDMVALKSGKAKESLKNYQATTDMPVVLIDVLDEETLREAGRLVWENREQELFTASSSGLQYALAEYWRSEGWLPAKAELPKANKCEAIAVVSGSCSPVTAAQIKWADSHGFRVVKLDVSALLEPSMMEAELERASLDAVAAIRQGQSAIICTALGPQDPAVVAFDDMARKAGLTRQHAQQQLGQSLARCLKSLLLQTGIRRIVVAGGDSSGAVAGSLGIMALTVTAGLEPGAPLCRAWSDDPKIDGLEIVLKGGQMGSESFFATAMNGQ